MIKNHLKIVLRNIQRNKLYSFINIFGLAIGLTCCLLIFLWVQDELSYDRFHENADNLYRVVENQYYSGSEPFPVAVTPAPLAEALRTDYPEIVNSCRFQRGRRFLVQHGEKYFYEDNVTLADPELFQMFSFPFVLGDPGTALNDPSNIVISESIANKYFGNENPIGQMMRIDNHFDFQITGVFKDIPKNSHLQFEILAPFVFIKQMGRSLDEWGSNSYLTYVQTQPGISVQDLDEKIKGIIKAHNEGSVTEIYLQPLTRIHLYSNYVADIGGHGDILYVNIFTIISLFVLLIACINYMNLATARSANRAREVGLRKVVGAKRSQLIRQFYSESIILTVISALIAIGLVQTLLPVFNELSGKQISLLSVNSYFWWGLLAIVLITGIISGSYPAVFLAGFQPASVLKGQLKSGEKGVLFRKSLVIIQFSLSVILIICTLIVSQQLDYIQNKKLGLDRDHVIYFTMNDAFREKLETAKTEMLSNKNVLAATAVSELPVNLASSTSGFDWEGKNSDETILMHVMSVNYDLTDVLKLEMAAGRFYSRAFPSDTANGVVVNEKAVEVMNMSDPIGKRFTAYGSDLSIIGVVKNFHFKPLQKEIEPLVMLPLNQWQYYFLARISPEDMPGTIKYMENVWAKLNPSYPFEYKFLDETYDRTYRAEQRMQSLFGYFTILGIFISCLGLLGLASFTAEQRRKEIGIRKVLGSTSSGLVVLLSKDYTKWVIISNLIAWPVAWYAMTQWLRNFSYRIEIDWWVFLIAGALALIIALLTVSSQAIKAAFDNPIDAIKYE